MRRSAAGWLLRVTGWKVVGEVPREGVLIGAPHTSYWDFVLMLLVMWRAGVPPRALVKKEVFRGPLGWLVRRLGGIPVDRQNPVGVVRELTRQARSGEPFLLIIAPEGTRSASPYWKSGFYRLARAARLPVTLGFVDGPSRTVGVGPTIRPTGDVVADMDVIREFYADKRGLHPAQSSEPKLREEEDHA